MVTADYFQEWRLKRYHYSIYLMPLFAGMCSLSQATKILSDTLKEQGVVDEANKVLNKFPDAPQVCLYCAKRYNTRAGVCEEYRKFYILDRGDNKIYRNKEHLILYY